MYCDVVKTKVNTRLSGAWKRHHLQLHWSRNPFSKVIHFTHSEQVTVCVVPQICVSLVITLILCTRWTDSDVSSSNNSLPNYWYTQNVASSNKCLLISTLLFVFLWLFHMFTTEPTWRVHTVQVFGPSVKQYSFHYTEDLTAYTVYKGFDYTQSAWRKMY